MLACSVLALCAVGVIGVTAANSATTQNRVRRSTFLDIVKDRPSSESSYQFPVLPVELPIQLGGHGGVNIPVLVLPVPIPVYTKSDSCDARQNKPVPDEKAEVTPQYILPPYVASRFHEDVASIRKPKANQRLTSHTEQKLDDSQNDYPSAELVIPESLPLPKPANRQLPQLVTTPPPTGEPVGNYATGSLIPNLPPARKPPSKHPAQLVTTDHPPTGEPVGNYVTGSLIPDLPPARKPPSRHPPQLVTSTDPPPTTEPVSNYVTGTLFPDPLPPRNPPSRQPSKVTIDSPTSDLVNSYVIGSLFPDPPSDRKQASRLPASLVMTEPPSTSNPNYITGALLPDLPPRKPMKNNGRLNPGTVEKKIHFTASEANDVIDETQERGHFEELVDLSARKYMIPNLQQSFNTSHMMPRVINKEENLEHVVEEGQIPYWKDVVKYLQQRTNHSNNGRIDLELPSRESPNA